MTKKILRAKVSEILSNIEDYRTSDITDVEREMINSIFTEGTETVQSVALTNICVTLVLPDQSPLAMQDPSGDITRRGLYMTTIRPFLVKMAKAENADWTPSPDVYSSNPFCVNFIDEAWIEARQKKLKGAEDLYRLLLYVSQNAERAGPLLSSLWEALKESLELRESMPRVPPRMSTEQLLDILSDWTADSDRGFDRLIISTQCLFDAVGKNLSTCWQHVALLDDAAPILVCSTQRHSRMIVVFGRKDHPSSSEEALVQYLLAKQADRGLIIYPGNGKPPPISKKDSAQYSGLGFRVNTSTLPRLIDAWMPLLASDDFAESEYLSSIAEMGGLSVSDRRSLTSIITGHLLPQVNPEAA